MVNVITQNALVQQYFLSKSELFKMLVLHTLFCLGLVLFRVVYTGEAMFLFLPWNLLLAYLPYIVSNYISKAYPKLSTGLMILLSTLWLLLVPNSFYIITDLFHLQQRAYIPLWYDLVLIIAFAWNGLIVGVLSVRQMEEIVTKKWHLTNEWVYIVPVMYLNALGIFIGRYLRFNSWDVITNPLGLISEVGYLLIHPFRSRFEWSMIICFTLLLTLFYLTLKKMTQHTHIKKGTL